VDRPDLEKIRRFALAVALILSTLVLAGVKLETPLHVAPLGIPLIVQRPDLLSIGLVLAAIYSMLRYVYYGMLIQPSPMRARRELTGGKSYAWKTGDTTGVLQQARSDFQARVDRWFPQIGRHRVTFTATLGQGATGVNDVNVPRLVRVMCWIENLDFMLPIGANVAAVGLWIGSRLC
jgi:hypothetical protein